MTLDRIQGLFAGLFLGDALGAPHEFKVNINVKYTGILCHRGFMLTRFQGKKELEVGQVTDDSEMSLALLRQLIQDHGKYVCNHVIISYLEWANSKGWMMGINTRTLLRGIKTIKGYEKRIEKIIEKGNVSQSNGCMMRCSPLALLSDDNCIIQDVNITNPNKVSIDCNTVYINALRLALKGMSRFEMYEKIKSLVKTKQVKEVFDQVDKVKDDQFCRNTHINKGWCLHALWYTLVVLLHFDNYSDAMEWVITHQPGSDTDTNACISGALLGALLGFSKMKKEENVSKNLEILLNADINSGPTPRPEKYGPFDFYELTEKAHNIYAKNHT